MYEKHERGTKASRTHRWGTSGTRSLIRSFRFADGSLLRCPADRSGSWIVSLSLITSQMRTDNVHPPRSVIGGILTSASSWRATFYLLAAFGGASFSSFIFFPDSWRRERSQLYQKATQRAIKRALEQDAHDEKKRIKKREKGLRSGDQTPANLMTVPQTPTGKASRSGIAIPAERTAVQTPTPEVLEHRQVEVDLEKKEVVLEPRRRFWSTMTPWNKRRTEMSAAREEEQHVKVKLSLTDVNPAPAMWHILKRPNNFLAVTCSGEATSREGPRQTSH